MTTMDVILKTLQSIDLESANGRSKLTSDLAALSKEIMMVGKDDPGLKEVKEVRSKISAVFKEVLESKNERIAVAALTCFQKLIAVELADSGIGKGSRLLPALVLDSIPGPASLSEEGQIELVKVLFSLWCSKSWEIHNGDLIKLLETCSECFSSSQLLACRNACQITFHQILSSLGENLRESLKDFTQYKLTVICDERLTETETDIIQGSEPFMTDSSKLLLHDVSTALKYLCTHVSSASRISRGTPSKPIGLFLTGLATLLAGIPNTVQQEIDMSVLLRQVVVPAISLLFSPPVWDSVCTTLSIKDMAHPCLEATQHASAHRGDGLGHMMHQALRTVAHCLRLNGGPSVLTLLEDCINKFLLQRDFLFNIDCLVALNDILADPTCLSKILCSLSVEESQKNEPVSLNSIKLVLQALAKCSRVATLQRPTLVCMSGLLESLEEIYQGHCLAVLPMLGCHPDSYQTDTHITAASAAVEGTPLPNYTGTAFFGVSQVVPEKNRLIQNGAASSPAKTPGKTVTWAERTTEHIIDIEPRKSKVPSGTRTSSKTLQESTGGNGVPVQQNPSNPYTKTRKGSRFVLNGRKPKTATRTADLFHIAVSSPSLTKCRSLDGLDQCPWPRPRIMFNKELRRTKSCTDLIALKPQPPQSSIHPDESPSVAERAEPPAKSTLIKSTFALKPTKSILRKPKPIVSPETKSDAAISSPVPLPTLNDKELTSSLVVTPEIRKPREVTVNGIPVSQLQRSAVVPGPALAKPQQRSGTANTLQDPMQSDALHKDGACNFVRCLLGTLPVVLTQKEPRGVDSVLQRFSADLVEAVIRRHLSVADIPHIIKIPEGAQLESYIRAEQFYVITLASLALAIRIHVSSLMNPAGVSEVQVSLDEFVSCILGMGFDVSISVAWIGELYSVITHHNILTKVTNRPLDCRDPLYVLISKACPLLLKVANSNEVAPVWSRTISRKELNALIVDVITETWSNFQFVFNQCLDDSNGSSRVDDLRLNAASSAAAAAISVTNHSVLLDCLRRLARICCHIRQHNYCTNVLDRICVMVCRPILEEPNRFPACIHSSELLALDTVLACGLDGMHLSDQYWDPVLRCCAFISELEAVFLHHTTNGNGPSPASLNAPATDSALPTTALGPLEFQSCEESSKGVYALSAAVDSLLEGCATCFDIDRLVLFVQRLVLSSEQQIRQLEESGSLVVSSSAAAATGTSGRLYPSMLFISYLTTLFLHKVRDKTCPLLHVFKLWNFVAAHLGIGASSRTMHVSKVSFTALRDLIFEIMLSFSELPHFNLHHHLLRPLQSVAMLQDSLTSSVVQALVILHEVVESRRKLFSGWRAVFSILRVVDTTALLRTESMLAMPNQGMLLDILKVFQENGHEALSTAFLPCLHAVSDLLRSMSSVLEQWKDPSRYSLQTPLVIGCIDEITHCLIGVLETMLAWLRAISSGDRQPPLYVEGSSSIEVQPWEPHLQDTGICCCPILRRQQCITTFVNRVTAKDRHGVVRLWFSLSRCLVSLFSTCQMHQGPVLELLLEVVGKAYSTEVQYLLVSFLIAPLLHHLIAGDICRDVSLLEMKLVTTWATQFLSSNTSQIVALDGTGELLSWLLRQILECFLLCMDMGSETFSQLTCACIRELLVSSSAAFNGLVWQVVVDFYARALSMSLSDLQLLMSCYNESCTTLLGGSALGSGRLKVKISRKRDLSPTEQVQLMKLAEQVFLTDGQLSDAVISSELECEPSKASYVISIISHDEKKAMGRMQLRKLVLDIWCSQVILEVLRFTLVEPWLLFRLSHQDGGGESSMHPLQQLSGDTASRLFGVLGSVWDCAAEFNARPGLRLLIRNLCSLRALPSMLRLGTVACSCSLLGSVQLCCVETMSLGISATKRILTADRSVFRVDASLKKDKSDSSSSSISARMLFQEACAKLFQLLMKISAPSSSSTGGSITPPTLNMFASLTRSPVNSPAKSYQPLATSSVESLPSHLHQLSSAGLDDSVTSLFSDRELSLNFKDSTFPVSAAQRPTEDRAGQSKEWHRSLISMLEYLTNLPTLQFKALLPIVYPPLTTFITTASDPNVQQLLADIMTRCGVVYGII